MAQPVTRIGDKTTGHGPWPPRPSTGGSGDVKVNNIGVVRDGDTWAPHNGGPNSPHKGEIGHTTSFSGSVKANNKFIARIGDNVEADTIAAGSPNVNAG
jgi:uncharacterized Zn-binding protein involved in type VI secretion